MKKLLLAILFTMIGSVALAQTNQPDKKADAEFLDKMCAHHDMGISMMKMAEKKAQNSQVKQMSGKMKSDQSKEIDQMMKWRKEYFASVPTTKDMMHDMDMSDLEKAKGKEFDKKYLDLMAKHHQDAVTMVNDYLPKLSNGTVKNFAQNIEKNQKSEIDKMNKMKSEIR